MTDPSQAGDGLDPADEEVYQTALELFQQRVDKEGGSAAATQELVDRQRLDRLAYAQNPTHFTSFMLWKLGQESAPGFSPFQQRISAMRHTLQQQQQHQHQQQQQQQPRQQHQQRQRQEDAGGGAAAEPQQQRAKNGRKPADKAVPTKHGGGKQHGTASQRTAAAATGTQRSEEPAVAEGAAAGASAGTAAPRTPRTPTEVLPRFLPQSTFVDGVLQEEPQVQQQQQRQAHNLLPRASSAATEAGPSYGGGSTPLGGQQRSHSEGGGGAYHNAPRGGDGGSDDSWHESSGSGSGDDDDAGDDDDDDEDADGGRHRAMRPVSRRKAAGTRKVAAPRKKTQKMFEEKALKGTIEWTDELDAKAVELFAVVSSKQGQMRKGEEKWKPMAAKLETYAKVDLLYKFPKGLFAWKKCMSWSTNASAKAKAAFNSSKDTGKNSSGRALQDKDEIAAHASAVCKWAAWDLWYAAFSDHPMFDSALDDSTVTPSGAATPRRRAAAAAADEDVPDEGAGEEEEEDDDDTGTSPPQPADKKRRVRSPGVGGTTPGAAPAAGAAATTPGARANTAQTRLTKQQQEAQMELQERQWKHDLAKEERLQKQEDARAASMVQAAADRQAVALTSLAAMFAASTAASVAAAERAAEAAAAAQERNEKGAADRLVMMMQALSKAFDK